MATWAPLRKLLSDVNDSVTLTWDELDDLVGGLPPSAENHREFWAGDRSGWPGFRTRDVRVGKQVTFERALGPASSTTGAKWRNVVGASTGVGGQGSDDDLLLRAAAATGIADREVLVREALQTLIRLASARKLAALGGSDPNAAGGARRRDVVR